MIASKIIDKAILMLGYDALKKTGSISGFEASALSALNIVYADLFFLFYEENFLEITDASQPVNLPKNVLYDVMPYGVAAFIASSQGDSDNQQFYSEIYNLKRKKLNVNSEFQDTIVTVQGG